MATLKDILIYVLLTSGSILCISLIVYLRKIVDSIVEIKNDVHRISDDLEPLLQSVIRTSDSITVLSRNVADQIEKVDWIVDEVKTRVETLLSFESKIKDSIDTPVKNLGNKLLNVKTAMMSFWQNYKNFKKQNTNKENLE